jgi:hypothetical protein
MEIFLQGILAVYHVTTTDSSYCFNYFTIYIINVSTAKNGDDYQFITFPLFFLVTLFCPCIRGVYSVYVVYIQYTYQI